MLDDKKSRLIQAAKEVFAEKGLEKTTISEIVKKTGIAQGTFYLYFPSKKALIPAIANDLLQTLLFAIKRETANSCDIWEAFRKIISTTFKVTESYKDVLALCYSGLAIDNILSDWEGIYNPYYDWLAEIIAEGIKTGIIRPDVEPQVTARMLIGLVESSAEKAYLFNSSETPSTDRQEQLFNFIYHALKV